MLFLHTGKETKRTRRSVVQVAKKNEFMSLFIARITAICLQRPFLVTKSSLWTFFQAECKIQCKHAGFFCNLNNASPHTHYFLCVKTMLFILRLFFWCWMMQKTFHFPRILSLYVYHSTTFPHLYPKHKQLADRGQPLDS